MNCTFLTANGHFAFWNLGLIGKCVVDFLLVIIELFSLRVTAEALRVNIDWKSALLREQGRFGPKFQVQGVAPKNHSSCGKTRWMCLLYGIIILAEVSFVLSQFTRLTDVRTRRRTEISWLIPPCTVCSAMKPLQHHDVIHVHYNTHDLKKRKILNTSSWRAQTFTKANPIRIRKCNKDFLVKDTSMTKFSWASDQFIQEIWAKLWNDALRHNAEQSFKKILDPDADADDCQNVISSFLSTDTSRVKFSQRSDK